jgi:drug/metabolite transporter (DMT)-like permease
VGIDGHAGGRGAAWRRAWPPLVGAVAFGASIPFTKLWLSDVPRLLAAGWIYLTSGIGLSIAIALRRTPPKDPLTRSDARVLAGAVLFGGVVAPASLLEGIDRTPANVASLLMNLEVVFTGLLAVLFLGERLDRLRILGVALVVAGVAGVGFVSERAEGPSSVLGALWIAVAALAWAIDNTLTRGIAGKDALSIARWKGLAGGTASIALGLALGKEPPARIEPWLGGAAIGVVAYGLSLVLFVLGMRSVGAARTIALFGVNPFIGVLLSAWVLGEPLTPAVAGLAVVLLAGVLLLVFEDPPLGATGPAPPGVT